MAAVFCASFSRAAMVRRRRVIRTRSSPRWRGARRLRRRGGARCRRGRLRNASTSPLVMRPSLPVPSPICSGATAVLRISLAAAGNGASAARRASAGRVAGRPTGGGRTPAGGLRRASRRSGSTSTVRRLRDAAAAGGDGGAGRQRLPSPRFRRTAPTSPRRPRGAAISAQRAGGRRVHLHGDLVGLQLHQRLVRPRPPRPRASSSARRSPR